MRNTNWWTCSLVTVMAITLFGVTSHGQAASGARQSPVPEIKLAPASPIPSVEGKDNFGAYCAVCHGAEGRGNGPAAPAMKATVPDLTTIAARHDGNFNASAVEYIIRGTGKTATPAHGTTEMPIWGQVFASADGNQAVPSMRIKNLVRYIESIQRRK